MERTPGKWKYDEDYGSIMGDDGTCIARNVDKNDAAYIVRAVNCHERLVRVVRAFRELMDHQEICYYRDPCGCHLDKQTIRRAKKKIDAALALAEGRG